MESWSHGVMESWSHGVMDILKIRKNWWWPSLDFNFEILRESSRKKHL